MMLTLRGTRYYLVYENIGIQDWIMLGLVPVSVVNAGMDTLWRRTVEIVVVIACLLMVLLIALIVHRSRDALRRRDTEILYRDELFTRLSRNVDDVFLMMDAETSRVDYVSPNIERLLGVPLEQVQQDIRALRALHPKDSPDHDKNFFAGIQCGEQSEWNADYAHQQTGERRWFHIVAMGSEVAGRTKYILVMSDRTADRKINQALSEAVAAAEAASRAKSTFLSNMSHDIRTPMNAIIGFTTLAVSNIDNQERVKDYLTKTLSSSRHLLALINDILDMSRIESGKLQLEETEVNLSGDAARHQDHRRRTGARQAARAFIWMRLTLPTRTFTATGRAWGRSCSTCCPTPSSSRRRAARFPCVSGSLPEPCATVHSTSSASATTASA